MPSYPDPYVRGYDFQSYQIANPTLLPPPGQRFNIELNSVERSTTEIVDFLRGIARSDGRLANGSVGLDQLDDSVSLGFNPPTAWAPLTDYTTNSTVFYANAFYRANVAHTSDSAFDASRWTLMIDFTGIATLGLGTAAVEAIGTSGATVPLNSTANTWSATQKHSSGALQIYDTVQTRNGGLGSEQLGTLLNFGINDSSLNRFGGAYNAGDQGGFLRFDTRSGEKLWSIFGRTAGSTSAVSELISGTGAGAIRFSQYGQGPLVADFAGNLTAWSYHVYATGLVSGGTDNHTTLQAYIDETPDGGVLLIPPGDFYFGTAALALTRPITIRGTNSAVGKNLDSGVGTRLLTKSAYAGNLFEVAAGVRGAVFEDITFANESGTAFGGTRRSGGAYIQNNDGGYYRISRCGFYCSYVGVENVHSRGSIDDCWFEVWKYSGIYNHNTSPPVSEAGGGTFTRNIFHSYTSPLHDSTAAILMEGVSYIHIHNNQIQGSDYGVKLVAKTGTTATISICDNEIDECAVALVRLEIDNANYFPLDPTRTVANIRICDNGLFQVNEATGGGGTPASQAFISVGNRGGSSPWIEGLLIEGNNFFGQIQHGSHSFIQVDADVTGLHIKNNVFNNRGAYDGINDQTGAPKCITIGAVVLNAEVLDNLVYGFTRNDKFDFSASSDVLFRHHGGIAFANLPNCKNGSSVYLTDGLAGSSPAGGGGTGAMTFKQGNQWKCH